MERWDHDSINEYIYNELGDWAKNVTYMLRDNLRRNKLVFSEELLRSFEHQVYSNASSKVHSLFIAFNDYGRMKEMKGLFYTKMPPVEVMEEFVEKVGLSKFKYVPGYKKGKIPSEDIAVKRIAWGISKSLFNNYKAKPKKWFARQFYGEINNLITTLMVAYQEMATGTVSEKLHNYTLGQLQGYEKQSNTMKNK